MMNAESTNYQNRVRRYYSSFNIHHSSLKRLPDRLAARRQRRQIAQLTVAVGQPVKIGAYRSQQAVLPGALGPKAVLIGRMASSNHFDTDAA
jgi:hypothetical protein